MRDRYLQFIGRHEAAWELGMAFLAVVFVAVGFAEDETGAPFWLFPLDGALTLVFIAEFGSRFLAARDRNAYLRGHLIDAVAVVPAVRGVRLLRLLRLLRLVRAFAGLFRFVSGLERLAHHRGLAWLVCAWLGVMVICSIALYTAENGANAAVSSPLDALWWGIATLTTVGYGDVYPVTAEGRIAASVLMLLGIGLFSGITATVTSYFVAGAPGPVAPTQALEALGRLHREGVVTDAEFEAKKLELLARL